MALLKHYMYYISINMIFFLEITKKKQLVSATLCYVFTFSLSIKIMCFFQVKKFSFTRGSPPPLKTGNFRWKTCSLCNIFCCLQPGLPAIICPFRKYTTEFVSFAVRGVFREVWGGGVLGTPPLIPGWKK